MTTDQVPAFRPLTGIYEPSAVQLLPDGRFLVVEVEKEHPLSLVTIDADGKVKAEGLMASLLQMFGSFWKLDDLEGLAADRAGFVYTFTRSPHILAMTMATRSSPARSWSGSASRAIGSCIRRWSMG